MDRPRSTILRELSVPECFALLATSTLGRLAVTQNALPALVPVRIRLVGEEVLVTSLVGDTVPLAARGVVALATGNLGEGLPNEWTVEVCGFLRSDSPALTRFEAHPSSLDTYSLSATKVRGWTTAAGPVQDMEVDDREGHPVG
jgi:hypothetical protein